MILKISPSSKRKRKFYVFYKLHFFITSKRYNCQSKSIKMKLKYINIMPTKLNYASEEIKFF